MHSIQLDEGECKLVELAAARRAEARRLRRGWRAFSERMEARIHRAQVTGLSRRVDRLCRFHVHELERVKRALECLEP